MMISEPKTGSHVISEFKLGNGGHFTELRQSYLTLGEPRRDAQGQISNAVLLLHNTTGSSREWLSEAMMTHLFQPAGPLDVSRHYLVMPDAIGFGQSSKPSDGLRTRFPNFRYHDIVRAQHRLLTEHLGVGHLKLILGLSMGGMMGWLWAGMFPGFMDALVPIACQPGPMSGRNWLQRRMQIELIRNDPGWMGGDYIDQPNYYTRAPFGALMTQSAVDLQRQAPTREAADALYERLVQRARQGDACDRLYQLEASMDYDPTPWLDYIEAHVLAINFADDELNPVALDSLQTGMARVKRGRAVVLPIQRDSKGHHTALQPALWKAELEAFLTQHPISSR